MDLRYTELRMAKQAIILAAEKFKVFAGGRSQILFNDSKAPQACTKTDRARLHTLPRWRLDLEGFALKIFAQIVSLGNRSIDVSIKYWQKNLYCDGR